MDAQTLLLWAARLACPLAIGVMLWFMLRQTSAAPDQPAEQRLTNLQRRRDAVERQIQGLEEQAGEGVTAGNPTSPEAP